MGSQRNSVLAGLSGISSFWTKMLGNKHTLESRLFTWELSIDGVMNITS